MLYIYSKLQSLRTDRRGVTALEYAVVGSVVIAAVVAAFGGFGSALSAKITGMLASMTSA